MSSQSWHCLTPLLSATAGVTAWNNGLTLWVCMRSIRWSSCNCLTCGAYRDVEINWHLMASTHGVKIPVIQDRPNRERIVVLCTKRYRTSPPAIWIQVLGGFEGSQRVWLQVTSSYVGLTPLQTASWYSLSTKHEVLVSCWGPSMAGQVSLIFSQSTCEISSDINSDPVANCRISRASYNSCGWLGAVEEITAVWLQSASIAVPYAGSGVPHSTDMGLPVLATLLSVWSDIDLILGKSHYLSCPHMKVHLNSTMLCGCLTFFLLSVQFNHINMVQNHSGIISAPSGVHATKNWSSAENKGSSTVLVCVFYKVYMLWTAYSNNNSY